MGLSRLDGSRLRTAFRVGIAVLAIETGQLAAATLRPGDIFVTEMEFFAGAGGVIQVNPSTGAQSVISSGGSLFAPRGIAITSDGRILVADPYAGGEIIEIDPDTGTQSIVFTGGSLVNPFGVAVTSNGNVWIADPGSNSIIRNNLLAPAETVITSGDLLVSPQGIAIEANGNVLVADQDAFGGNGGVVRVDQFTGNQTELSSGGFFFNPTGIAVDANGGILVIDDGADVVVRVDPVSGAQSLVSSGQFFVNPTGIAIEQNGNILIADFNSEGGTGAVIRIDPSSGNQTIVSSHGNFQSPFAVAVVPPAPGCSSTVTTIDGLRLQVNALNTSGQTKNVLTNTLNNVQQALDNGNNKTARSRTDLFISKVVSRSNFQETNPDRIILGEASSLICGAANVLVGITLP